MTYWIKSFKTFILATFISVLFTHYSSAQEVENHLIYFSNEMNVGNYFGYTADINYVYKEKYSAKVGFTGAIRISTNQPSDYSPGLIGLFSFGLIGAYETMAVGQLQVGRIFYLNQNRNSRLNASVGIGYTSVETIENWQKTTAVSFNSNYTYDVVRNQTVSLIINPKLEFPLGRVFGFTVSPTAIINSERNYYGVGLGYMIGRIRSKPTR